MRIALDQNDRGYIENAASAIVTVDGESVHDWTIADEHLQAVMLKDGTLRRGKVLIVAPEASRPTTTSGKKKHG